MPWLPIYADKQDIEIIIDILNADNDIAFIIRDDSDSSKLRWKAVAQINDTSSERLCIWHIPSGPLPLYKKTNFFSLINDPWCGWDDLWADRVSPKTPYFGIGHVGVVWLNNHTLKDNDKLAISSFEWIGNHYSVIGNKAHPSTETWWKKLRGKIAKLSVKIGRTDALKPEIYCMNSANAKIQKGMPRDMNPI